MLIKTILNRLGRFRSFVFSKIQLLEETGNYHLEIEIKARKNSTPLCGWCEQPGRKHGHSKPRRFQFIPLWGIATYFLYAPRRVDCVTCGITTEKLPWANGNEPITTMFQQFLAHWARKLSWQQVAGEFGVSWRTVFKSVDYMVSWGLAHRDLCNIISIGVDEICIWSKYRFATMVYQIDQHCRRLLWIGETRTAESFAKCFQVLGAEVCAGIKSVCSDMWKRYLKVVKEVLPQAVHVLDRFHIVANLNKALDQVRSEEAQRLKLKGDELSLKKTRWCLLKKPGNLTGKQRSRLNQLLKLNLKTVRAYLLAQDFRHFWTYKTVKGAAAFLKVWTQAVLRSRIKPLKKMARQLRNHEQLILNYFRTKKLLSSGVVEALNNNAKVTIRKAYGFKRFYTLKIALFHNLGGLPDPPLTNKFW